MTYYFVTGKALLSPIILTWAKKDQPIEAHYPKQCDSVDAEILDDFAYYASNYATTNIL